MFQEWSSSKPRKISISTRSTSESRVCMLLPRRLVLRVAGGQLQKQNETYRLIEFLFTGASPSEIRRSFAERKICLSFLHGIIVKYSWIFQRGKRCENIVQIGSILRQLSLTQQQGNLVHPPPHPVTLPTRINCLPR